MARSRSITGPYELDLAHLGSGPVGTGDLRRCVLGRKSCLPLYCLHVTLNESAGIVLGVALSNDSSHAESPEALIGIADCSETRLGAEGNGPISPGFCGLGAQDLGGPRSIADLDFFELSDLAWCGAQPNK